MVSDWSAREIEAAVAAYLRLQKELGSGKKVNRQERYRQLSAETGRTAAAIKRRMHNISHVLDLMGREGIPGLKPLSHVGAKVAKEIGAALAMVEKREVDTRLAFEIEVEDRMRRGSFPRPKGNLKPGRVPGKSGRYNRNPEVAAWVRLRAKGRCEACGLPAPFRSPKENPYLEVHHVRLLADGGSDRTENAVALCPNCHRELHYGSRKAQKKSELYDKLCDLIQE